MKPRNFFPGFFTFAVFAGLLAGATVQAADVRQYVLLKGQSFTQTSATTTSPSGVDYFQFQCFVEPQTNGAVTNMTLTKPGPVLVPVPPNDGKFALEQSFSSQAALDAAFPNGTYTLTLQTINDGTRNPTLSLTGDAYLATPHISNFAEAQAVVPPNDFTLTWDALGGTVSDYVSLELRDDADHTVVSSPGFGQPGALNGTSTSFFIKGRTLRPGKVYQGELFIAHSLQAPDQASYPGATGIAAYTKSLKFTVTTTGTPTGPALGQFDLVFNFNQGTFDGTNGTIPFPQPLAYYFALYNIQNDTGYPTSVVFTGPGGSGLTNVPSQVNGSSFGDSAFYSSPQVNFSPANLSPGAIFSPTPPSGGIYTVNYKGNAQQFNLLDPRSADQQILVVPTVVLSPTDTVQEIRWTYKTTNGTPVAPPAFMERIEIRVNGANGGRLYDVGQNDDQRILPATTNHTVIGSVAWTNVSSIQMVFRDTPGNQYVSYWNRAPQPLEITTANLPNALQGSPYNFLLSSAGGTQPVNWSLTSGFLPSGLNLMPGTGEISGTPGENGTFSVTFRAMDSATAVTNRTLSLTVQAGSFPAPTFTNAFVSPSRQLQAQIITVSNQTYSLESSTDLVHWVLRHTFTATSNLSGVVDPDSVTQSPRQFYRLRIGR
ncbi:MAG: hypothetical protein RL514_1672 [Verrucomicrobiota bacterium]|jgi:hypothetical protein